MTFLKWVGGKRQLLPELMKLLPPIHGRYYEAFIGGGALFFHLASQKKFTSAVINDVNPELVNAYRVVKEAPLELMFGLDDITQQPDWNTEAYFRMMRVQDFEHPVQRAARFLYLNKTCFNGLWRVNKKEGKFNTPFGRYANPKLYDRSTLLACSEALQRAEIRCGSYEEALEDAKPGDVVYLDPPYVPVSLTANFTAYAGEFGPVQQAELAQKFRQLVAQGITCLESNSDTPLVRKLYSEYGMRVVKARRSVNSSGSGRGPINELVVLGYPNGQEVHEITNVFDFGC
jgi:DNA adenine methylase